MRKNFVLQAAASALLAAVVLVGMVRAADNEGIAIWGHSMPSDVTAEGLAKALAVVGAARPDRPIINQSIGGSGIITSLVRQGGIAWTAEVAGGVIPAAGRVELTNLRSPSLAGQLGEEAAAKIMGDIRWPEFWPDDAPQAIVRQTWVEIGGVIGQLGREDKESKALFFQRRDPGEAVKVDNPVAVRMVAVGPAMAHDLDTLDSYLNILWGPGVERLPWPEIFGEPQPQDVDPAVELEANRRAILALIQGSLDRMSAREKRLILIMGMPYTAPASNDKHGQSERISIERGREIYREHFPEFYFDYVAASLTGLGPVPPAREWFEKTHPELFADPEKGWAGEFHLTPEGFQGAGGIHTPKEPAAVAEIRLLENGGGGVVAAPRVATSTPDATRWVKTGLFVGVEAADGVATRLTVREGGRGYEVGDKITIAAGAAGNREPITGEVTAVREETIGTVRHPDGTVDVAHSYSQWDVDNGHWPRCFRRDRIHFSHVGGAGYLQQLLAARIKELGW